MISISDESHPPAMNIAHQIYPHLPSWARLAAVNARGYYLLCSRYDANTEKLVEEALERDHWSGKDWNIGGRNGCRTSFTGQLHACLITATAGPSAGETATKPPGNTWRIGRFSKNKTCEP